MAQTFTLAQVAEHKAQGHSWIVIHNKGNTFDRFQSGGFWLTTFILVYHVTSYIAEDNHPGGVEVE
jgi:cytochrome b involved in lipid metabolism